MYEVGNQLIDNIPRHFNCCPTHKCRKKNWYRFITCFVVQDGVHVSDGDITNLIFQGANLSGFPNHQKYHFNLSDQHLRPFFFQNVWGCKFRHEKHQENHGRPKEIKRPPVIHFRNTCLQTTTKPFVLGPGWEGS